MALVKRSTLLGALVMAAAVLSGSGAMRSAHAVWQVTVSSNTTGPEVTWDEATQAMATRTINDVHAPAVETGPTFSSGPYYTRVRGLKEQQCSSYLTQTLTLTLDWVKLYPTDPDDPPTGTDDVRMKIQGTASISAVPTDGTPEAGTMGGKLATVSTLPNDADPKQIITRADNTDAILVYAFPSRHIVLGPYISQISAKARAPLIQRSNAEGVMVLVDQGSSIVGSLGMTATFDNRSMILTRAGARLNSESRNLVDGIMVSTGHGRWSYTRRHQYVQNDQTFIQDSPVPLTAEINAFGDNWSSDRKWKWSPESQGFPADTQTSKLVSIPDGGGLHNTVDQPDYAAGWYHEPANDPGTHHAIEVSYTATDPDGLTATAKYILILHNEFENLRAGAQPNQVVDTEYRFKENGTLRYFWNNPNLTFTASFTTAWQYTFTGSFMPRDFINLGGWVTHTTTDTATWSMGVATSVPAGKQVYAYTLQHQEQKQYLVDHYDEGGLIGTENQWAEDTNRRGIGTGFSKPYNNTDYTSRDHPNEGTPINMTAVKSNG